MGAPQIIFLALMILGTCVGIAKHGQPRTPYDANTTVISFGLTMWLLWWGGFFS